MPRDTGPRQKKCEQGDRPNHHAFGTFGISPAGQARMPKAGGDRSSRTLGQEIFTVSPRFFRIIVAFAAAGLLAFVGAVIFLGYSSASGAPVLEYRGKVVSAQQYFSDIAAVIDFLTNLGFKEVSETDMPASIERKAADPRYELAHSFEYPVVFSRPISLRLYSDREHESVLVVFYARNPTWAVPFQRAGLRKFAVIPLVSFWKQLTTKENA